MPDPKLNGGMTQMVSSLAKAWRDDFNGADLNGDWQIISQGPGQSYSLAGGELTINAGTGAGEEFILRSTATYTIPFRVWWIGRLSQRIANQEIRLEVVNADGDMVAGWLLDGTSASSGKYYSANGGNLLVSGAGIINSTASDQILELELNPDEFWPSCRIADSAASKSGVWARHRNIPDPQPDYYLRVRVTNLATAPASNTQLILGAVLVQDINELTAEITGGRGDYSGAKGIAVYVSNSQALNNSAGSGVGTHHHLISAATTNATLVKASQGTIYSIVAANEHATATYYLKIGNKASPPTPGTDVPVLTFPIKPGQTLNLNHDVGWRMNLGIVYWITANKADLDTTAIGAGDVVLNISYT